MDRVGPLLSVAHFFPFLPKIFSVRLGRRSPSTASRIGPPTPLADPCFCSAGGAENAASCCITAGPSQPESSSSDSGSDCSAIARRMLIFPFSWLTLGELSSVALNIRWFLINSGRGESVALQRTQLAFAGLFVVTRVIIYGVGLAHLFVHREALLSRDEATGVLAHVPAPLLWLVLVLLVGGYGLNLLWMTKIVRMASRGRTKEGREKKP